MLEKITSLILADDIQQVSTYLLQDTKLGNSDGDTLLLGQTNSISNVSELVYFHCGKKDGGAVGHFAKSKFCKRGKMRPSAGGKEYAQVAVRHSISIQKGQQKQQNRRTVEL